MNKLKQLWFDIQYTMFLVQCTTRTRDGEFTDLAEWYLKNKGEIV